MYQVIAYEFRRQTKKKGRAHQGFSRAYDVLVPDGYHDTRPGAAVSAQVFLPVHYRFMNQLAQVPDGDAPVRV
jgi:hypothetical protein